MAKRNSKNETPDTEPTGQSIEEAPVVTEDISTVEPVESVETPVVTEAPNFSIQEEPEKPNAIPPALMFDVDTKVTPKLIIQRMREQEDKRKQLRETQSSPANTGPRVETRAQGRRTIRHN